MPESPNLKKQFAGIILSPLFFGWLGAQMSYWTGNIASNSNWPFIGMACGLIIGFFSIYMIKSIPKFARIMLFVAYIPAAIIFMFVVQFFTACMNGDCI